MSNHQPRAIAWLDLETTGSALEGNKILELGLIITDLELAEIGRASWISNALTPEVLSDMDPVVLRMHAVNDLIIDSRIAGVPIDTIDTEATEFIHEVAGKGGPIPYAGSGVGHFDRKFLERDLPIFTSRLTYWGYDVGVIRRTLKHIVDIHPERIDNTAAKPHRALPDTELHLLEMRSYRDLLRAAFDSIAEYSDEATVNKAFCDHDIPINKRCSRCAL